MIHQASKRPRSGLETQALRGPRGAGYDRLVTAPAPYALLPGSARKALAFYAAVFGARAQLHTFAEFNRSDGPPDAIAHGGLVDSPVVLFAADAAGEERTLDTRGLMFSPLGIAEPSTPRTWFRRLADGGTVVDGLAPRP